LPFKCNLQRYNALLEGVPAFIAAGGTVGLCTLNQVDP
jgi:hypothetical protein